MRVNFGDWGEVGKDKRKKGGGYHVKTHDKRI